MLFLRHLGQSSVSNIIFLREQVYTPSLLCSMCGREGVFYVQYSIIMKTRLIGGVVLLFVLLGCSNRVDLSYKSAGKEVSDLVEVSFSANFSDFHYSGLRTYPSDANEERKHRTSFNGIRIVFYSVNQANPEEPDKVVYAFDKDISAEKGLFSGADLGGVDEPVESGIGFKIKGNERIKEGDYIVYVFATLNSELKAVTAIGQSFSLLQKPLNYIDEEDIVDNRMVCNHYISEPIAISKDFFADHAVGRIYTLPQAKLSAINAVASVTWAPVVKNSEMEIIGDMLQFYPDVQNRKYLLFPEADQNLSETFSLTYPIDANYTGFASKSLEELSSDFIYRTNLSKLARHVSHLSPDRVSAYRAIPENTLASSESKSNTVTRLIIRVRMMPKSLKSTLTAEQLADINLGWVNYLGTPYEATAFVEMYSKAKVKTTKSSEDERLIEIADRFLVSGKLPVAKSENGYEDSDVQYYHESYSYYALPITHFSLEQLGGTINNGGYFGVVRNHHYKIDIKSFAGIGKTSYKYLPYDLDLLSEQQVDQDQIVTDMDVVNTVIDVLY